MSDTGDSIVVHPVVQGVLTLGEISTLAGLSVETLRGYHSRARAGFPKSAWKSGNYPVWNIADIVEWLASRWYSQTTVEVRPDGAVVVTHASDYRERKAAGKVGQRKR